MGILSSIFHTCTFDLFKTVDSKNDNLYLKYAEDQSAVLELAQMKTDLIQKNGKAYELWVDDMIVGYYPNIHQLSNKNNLKFSGVYRAFKDGRTYKNRYDIEVVTK